MSDIQAIRERHEKDKKFFAEERQLPWEQDDCILAVTDIATLLSLLTASEARAEAAEAKLAEALLNPDPWRPIEEAPKDREVLVYCPPAHGLRKLICTAEWHPDAGFTVCKFREPTHFREMKGPGQ